MPLLVCLSNYIKMLIRGNTVTHGLMSRVFLMKWYHFSVEYFEDLRNVNHCEFLIMRKSADSGKYILENNLRTWSELKRERIAAAAAKAQAQALPTSSTTPSIVTTTASTPTSEKDKEKEARLGSTGAASPSSAPAKKKWGGCPNGCDHSKHYYKKENSMHAMQLNGRPAATESLISRRPAARRWQSSSEEDDDIRGRISTNTNNNPSIDVEKSLQEMVSSPDGTPSFISVEDRLRNRLKSPNDLLHLVRGQGRDFGGSASGKSSIAGSDTEFSAEEDAKKKAARGKGVLSGRIGVPLGGSRGREESGMRRGALADALGDQSDVGSDAGAEPESELDNGAEPSPAMLKAELVREGGGVNELEDLEKAEKEDKSIKGSVY